MAIYLVMAGTAAALAWLGGFARPLIWSNPFAWAPIVLAVGYVVVGYGVYRAGAPWWAFAVYIAVLVGIAFGFRRRFAVLMLLAVRYTRRGSVPQRTYEQAKRLLHDLALAYPGRAVHAAGNPLRGDELLRVTMFGRVVAILSPTDCNLEDLLRRLSATPEGETTATVVSLRAVAGLVTRVRD